MFQCIKKHPLLLVSLFIIPLFFNLILWLVGSLDLTKLSPEILLSHLQTKLLIPGLIFGSTSGLMSVLVTILLFNREFFSIKIDLGEHPILWTASLLVPLCQFSLSLYLKITKSPELQAGLSILSQKPDATIILYALPFTIPAICGAILFACAVEMTSKASSQLTVGKKFLSGILSAVVAYLLAGIGGVAVMSIALLIQLYKKPKEAI